MNQIIECVPNISEGKNEMLVSRLTEYIKAQDVLLANVNRNGDANRTVFTIFGAPQQMLSTLFGLYQMVLANLDMAQHSGVHPRVGAIDVCPIVPIAGCSVQDCQGYVEQLAERVGQELDIPVYLYEKSASNKRMQLSEFRKGEFEGLEFRNLETDWRPDYGPTKYHPQFGITVMGVRDFLIAWNINLEKPDLALAKKIARLLRESGGVVELEDGGRGLRPGMFVGVKAIGWELRSQNRVQISMNVTKPDRVNLAELFLGCQNLARQQQNDVLSSELIGLISQKYLVKAGRYFCQNRNESEDQLALIAIKELGMAPQQPRHFMSTRVIEFVLKDAKF